MTYVLKVCAMGKSIYLCTSDSQRTSSCAGWALLCNSCC